MQGSAEGFIKMTENNKGGKSLDFSADLNLSKENLKNKKTTITIDDEIAFYLEGKRAEGYNISAFVNRVLKERKEVESAIIRSKYGFMPCGFVQFPMLLHKEVAEFFSFLILNCGAVALANKIAEILSADSCGVMSGDCQVYGSSENLNKSLSRFVRAVKRFKETGV